ncbi:MAG: type I-E CRISPR-associated protein Cas6/Cse3/CasE [Pseudomonadales bacterium]|nr:type I-E CRISPR-associated protein Cas6/Cse3/CasE [Pseudomonadales bacterium]
MYLSKLTYSSTHRAEMVKALTLHRNLFHEHQMIWNLMPLDADAKRDFLYRKDESERFPFYYLLSERLPDNVPDFLQVQSKAFQPQLMEGSVYGFSLRANAVVTRKIDDNSKKRIRRDIIDAKVDEYKQRFPVVGDRPASAVIHHEAGEQWLSAQGEKHGFKLRDLSVSNHQFHKHQNKDSNSGHRQFASLDFDGTLEITNPEQFVQSMYSGRSNSDPKNDSLVRGLGRSMAFGCGLMLIRKA